MKIDVLEVARQEFDEAFEYYESRQPGLGEDFRKAVREQVHRTAPRCMDFGPSGNPKMPRVAFPLRRDLPEV